MEGVGGAGEVERGEINSETQVLRDRFRLNSISIAEAEAKRNGMDASEVVVACIADLAFKYAGKIFIAYMIKRYTSRPITIWNIAQQLAKDVELFAQHANRKSVNMEDVILSAHRNEHLSTLLRTFSIDLKTKEPQSERKRKKATKKEDQATT